MTAKAPVLMLVSLAACSSAEAGPDANDPKSQNVPCRFTGMDALMPRAHIGPDVAVELSCSGTAGAPIASFSVEGARGFEWSAVVSGDTDAIGLDLSFGSVCPGLVAVVTARVTAPAGARPGDTFSANIALSSNQGAFPAQTVKVSAKVVVPTFTLAPSDVDFGFFEGGSGSATRSVTLRNGSNDNLFVTGSLAATGPFRIEEMPTSLALGATGSAVIRFEASASGAYDGALTWTGSGTKFQVPAECLATQTVTVHARVGAEGDAGAD